MRIYLDHNATTPLRAAARQAMQAAMDNVGNPSSIHHEGRAAKHMVEQARTDIAEAFGIGENDIIFTSSATEAAALGCAGQGFVSAGIEHDAVAAWTDCALPATDAGQVQVVDPAGSAVQLANSETGIINDIPDGIGFCDMTQAFGKIPVSFAWSGAKMACASAHKIGGPKGIGCLIAKRGTDIAAQLRGGGQEMGRRAGTENIIGIAGFAAAAKAAVHDLESGVWDDIKKLRIILENALESANEPPTLIGKDSKRLPNTLCFAAQGWKSETQVMQMDLAGFAVSAGSACSSGKLRQSPVLAAMGFDDAISSSVIRVSLGLGTTEEQVLRFADAWLDAYRRFLTRKAG